MNMTTEMPHEIPIGSDAEDALLPLEIPEG